MKTVGITGGIGSGKTTVCEIFKILGIPVYQADDRAKFLMQNDPNLVSQITAAFGAESYIESQLNRPYLAKMVFSDPNQTAKINALVHPAVSKDFQSWVSVQRAPYVIKEAALMIESGSYKQLDKLITVTASMAIRIQRIQKRDPQRSMSEIKAIIDKQVSEEKRMELSDLVVNNDGQSLLIPQVLELHEKMLS
ncbi:MAG: dephospho-CoA kinase [Reichenbachiella sp.]|uniref:dephospho-CoA kinase n=1 Tax=Reichenbachiella sp. TaxID=2184521 RepID=UPI003264263A